MTPQPNQQQIFRMIAAEAIAKAFIASTDPAAQLVGVDQGDLSKRALLKLQIDPQLKMAVTAAINVIEKARDQFSDYRIHQLLQPGVHTMAADGRQLSVEVDKTKIRVKDILTGAGLNVADGAFVIFIDSRAASGPALKKWQELVKEDTRLLVIPLDPPPGQTVEQCVAAKRQSDDGFADATGYSGLLT